ncbi:MAG: hypothetical protein A2Y17_05690 [Clostridiales bacterium GWF2_38_85]|nr:MAG: hypothetical protein A2Y17_05690 [Clostridiales bacterium GWF2_38_85]HBL84026.1 hypothetical protein [Clostridiales bacterium]
MKKIISMLLVIMLLGTILVACKNDNETSNNSTDQSAVSGTESEDSGYTAEIPDVDYDGIQFKILTTAFSLSKMEYSEFGYGDELEENVINVAVAERNAAVEELLNIEIVEECIEATERFSGGALNDRVLQSMQMGSDDYYLVVPSLYNCAVLAKQNTLYDLMDFEYLHGLEAEWWDQYFVDDIEIDGRLFFATGDIGFQTRNSLTVCFFNKNMFQEFGLEDPYELVNNKTWTFDKLIQWSTKTRVDLDNNNIIDYTDKFGVAGQNDLMWAMFYGSGERLASKDAEGMPQITMYNAHSVNVVEKILELMTNSDYFVNANNYFTVSNTPVDLTRQAFIDERCLIFCEGLGSVEKLRNMAADTDFGILPIPLYDENQENYQHMINPWSGNAVAIPKFLSTDDAEMASVVMEALGAASKNILTPAYYELALKKQKTRDEESQAMLDVIFDTIGCDMGHIYNWGGMGAMLHKLVDNKLLGQFTSEYQSIEATIKAAMDSTVEIFNEIP